MSRKDPASQALDVMARTIWGEARGEPIEGKIAVAHVILNRVEGKRWYGDDIIEVCKKPWQFSAWNFNDPNRHKLASCHASGSWPSCVRAATTAMLADYDPTHGATHYHAKSILPGWTASSSMERKAEIGGHIFYREG